MRISDWSSDVCSSDLQWVHIAANSEPLFAKLMALIGRSDLVGTSGYSGNRERVENADVLDQLITGWSCRHDAKALIALLDAADIPNSNGYTPHNCAPDPNPRDLDLCLKLGHPPYRSPT